MSEPVDVRDLWAAWELLDRWIVAQEPRGLELLAECERIETAKQIVARVANQCGRASDGA